MRIIDKTLSYNLFKIWSYFLLLLPFKTREARDNICSTIKKNLLLYCLKFSVFVIVDIHQNILIKRSTSQRNVNPIEIINFMIESLKFQNRLLNGASYLMLLSIC